MVWDCVLNSPRSQFRRFGFPSADAVTFTSLMDTVSHAFGLDEMLAAGHVHLRCGTVPITCDDDVQLLIEQAEAATGTVLRVKVVIVTPPPPIPATASKVACASPTWSFAGGSG